jgi:hypothetical protein
MSTAPTGPRAMSRACSMIGSPAAEEVIFHGVDLSKVGRVSIDLWSSQPHPATGKAPESGSGCSWPVRGLRTSRAWT